RWPTLQSYRSRELITVADDDESVIKDLFDDMLEASRSVNGKTGEARRSPVSVAKALHLLAPMFFPLWDDKIAAWYGCRWPGSQQAFPAYLSFMQKTMQQLESL